jgi:GNAT superfamily N-acetyltransferase
MKETQLQIRRDNAARDILVATTEEGVVGFLSGGLIREPVPGYVAEIHAIYLLEAVQRAGIGRRLVREWATLALARGLRAAVVRVLAANPARFSTKALTANVARQRLDMDVDDRVIVECKTTERLTVFRRTTAHRLSRRDHLPGRRAASLWSTPKVLSLRREKLASGWST